MMMLVLTLWMAQDVQELIWKLGDDDPRVREQAQAELTGMGRSATEALKQAARGGDPEIRARAEAILQRIQWPALAKLREKGLEIVELTGHATQKLFPEARVFMLYERELAPWAGSSVKVGRVCEQDIALFENAVFPIPRLWYSGVPQKQQVQFAEK